MNKETIGKSVKYAFKESKIFVKKNPDTAFVSLITLIGAGYTAFVAYNLYLLIKHFPQR